MQKEHDLVKVFISNIIHQGLVNLGHGEVLSVSNIYENISKAPNPKMGHLAFPCFPLAKELKKAPPMIANELKEKVEAALEDESGFVEKVITAGPYLNFFLDFTAIGKGVLSKVIDGEYFKETLVESAPKTMIEYSQPNTHKELHVGHMRNLCLGHALILMHRYCGFNIVSATYPGDMGTHVAKCLWYLKKHNKEEVPETRKGAWLGRIYTEANNLLEAQRGTEHEEVNRTELTAILKQLESGEGEYYDLWQETRAWSIELMKDVYQWAGVEFDHWYFESMVDSDSVKLVNEYFEKGVFVKDQGAIGMDLSDDNLGFCILLKTDGNGLYSTKDVELARRKFEDYKIEKNIYIVDKRQALHFSQVFKVLEKMGFENAKDCYHLQYDFVELPDGAMSSRKGNIIPLQKLIDEMEHTIKTEYLSKYNDTWSPEHIDNTASIVANGAIKYGMLKMDTNRKIVFDMKEWLKLDGESGPYIQYAYARINSLCEKLEWNKENQDKVDWSLLDHQLEKDLILQVIDFNNVVGTACLQYKTSSICSYLYSLAKSYSSFYAECSVANAESEELKQARLALSYITGEVIKEGLSILGIDSPNRM